MSGGASIPSAPNLSGNISNANTTAGTATSNAAQTMNTAQAYNTNAQQNLANVTNTNNSMAGQIGAQATQNIGTYGSTFVPLQSQEAQEAQNYGSTANVQKLQGQAVANSNAANQASLQNSQAALAAEGVDPASVHGAALQQQAAVTGAANTAGAATQSAINTQNTAFNMTNTANQLGTQVGQMGTTGAATAAGVADQGQSTINSTNTSGVNNLTAANSYLNTDVNANNSSTQANQAQFSDQQTQYQDQSAQNNAAMGAIGSVVGGALTFMQAGGAVEGSPLQPKTGPFTPIVTGRHAGLPVNARHFQQTSALTFHNMDGGGQVTAKGALPVGAIPGTTDRKPAMLTPGEFVIPHDVVQHLGAEKLHKLVDKTREDINKRRAIPIPHAPHMTMN